MAEVKIYISTTTFGKESDLPLRMLQEANIAYELNPLGRKLTPEETLRALKGKVGVIAGTELYSRDIISQLNDLKVISRCGSGIDGIALDALKEKGIALFKTDFVHVSAVAELTIGAILSLSRKLPDHFTSMRNRHWARLMGRDVSKLTVGVVGLGKVALKVVEVLHAFGSRILAFDPYFIGTHPEYITRVDRLEDLWPEADVITLHVPLTDETRNIINAGVLEMVKPNVLIINTARGELIQQNDLYNFLNQNPDASAFLDVFWSEPFSGDLLSLPNVYATPHIGTFTRDTRISMETEAVSNLINFLKAHG